MVTEPGILPAAPPDEPREETKQALRKIRTPHGPPHQAPGRRAKYTRHTDSRWNDSITIALGRQRRSAAEIPLFWRSCVLDDIARISVGLKSGLDYTRCQNQNIIWIMSSRQVMGLASDAYCVVIFLLVGGLFAYHLRLSRGISRRTKTCGRRSVAAEQPRTTRALAPQLELVYLEDAAVLAAPPGSDGCWGTSSWRGLVRRG